MGALKEAVRFYRTERKKEYLKRQLLSRKTDFHLLEQLIQDVNENPDLRIEVRLNDGTVLLLKTYHKTETHDLINGSYEVVE
jgi:hypothetical protein